MPKSTEREELIASKWGVGYGRFPEGRACAFGGYGGSLMVIAADRRMTYA
jgi:hypothetical protein